MKPLKNYIWGFTYVLFYATEKRMEVDHLYRAYNDQIDMPIKFTNTVYEVTVPNTGKSHFLITHAATLDSS